MKFLFRSILILLLATMLVLLSKYGPGHVIIFISQYRLDMALSTIVIAILLVFIIAYYLIRFVATINSMPGRLKQWHSSYQLLQSRKFLNRAGLNYFEGNYTSIYKNAKSSITKEVNKENKFLALMLAYKASGFMRNALQEEELLVQLDAYQDKKWQLAKAVAIAQNQYLARRYAQCLDSLNKVIALDKRHILAHKIKLKTYINLHNYDKAFEELVWLNKHNYLDEQKLLGYKLKVYSNLFEVVGDEAELNHFYRKLDRDDRANMLINRYYLNALIRLKRYSKALDLAEISFGNGLTVYDGMLKIAKVIEDVPYIERLFKLATNFSYKDNLEHTLMLILGICNFKLKNYLEGRKNLEDAMAIKPSIDACVYLLLIATNIQDMVLHDVIESKLKSLII